MLDVDYDIGIIGGGPAGSTTASYLAKAGLRVALFEGDRFPRPHVGESLVPATTAVLDQIGALKKVDAAGFPRKYGAAWTSAEAGSVPKLNFQRFPSDLRWAQIQFAEREQQGVTQDYTYHVDRGIFDKLLLDHAAELGAEVFQGHRVRDVDLSGPAPLLTVRSGAGESNVRVRMVVDASGRRTVLGNKLKLKISDPVFNQYAIHTWFEGLDRNALAPQDDKADYIFIHFLPITDTWVWQIPITDTVTSIGVVTQKKRVQAAGQDREAFFWDSVGSRPEMLKALQSADRIRDFKVEGDYSYGMREIVGDGWALVGDAARFVDPIFSSGVSVALNGARLLSADIIEAAAKGSFERASFHRFESTLRRAVRHWYEFISIYYRLNILYTAFVGDPRYRIDVLRMLQGDVYDADEPAALTKMRAVLQDVENDPDHRWHKYLGSLRAPSVAPAF